MRYQHASADRARVIAEALDKMMTGQVTDITKRRERGQDQGMKPRARGE